MIKEENPISSLKYPQSVGFLPVWAKRRSRNALIALCPRGKIIF